MSSFWSGELISTALGFVAGILTAPISRALGRWYQRLAGHTDRRRPPFDAEDGGFFPLVSWSPRRPLTPSRVEVLLDEAAWEQTWCDPDGLRAAADAVEDHGGPSVTLRDLQVDHRESTAGQRLALTFAPSRYGDLIAASAYFQQNPDEVGRVLSLLRDVDTREMVRGAPASVVAINVTVTSSDDRLLALRRSSAVRTSQGVWTLGPNETMAGPGMGQAMLETPHLLARRCLAEEVGLLEDGVERLEISWLGYNVPGALVHIVAHARSRLRSAELDELLRSSEGAYEADHVQWLPATWATVRSIAANSPVRRKGDGSDRWIPSAPLAAAEWWTWRRALLSD